MRLKTRHLLMLLPTTLLTGGCVGLTPRMPPPADGTAERIFLQDRTRILLLHDVSDGGQVLVAPGLQGRILTSTVGDRAGDPIRFGWIDYNAMLNADGPAPGAPVGGEDRFGLGPAFDTHTPFHASPNAAPPTDGTNATILLTADFPCVAASETRASFSVTGVWVNAKGTAFPLAIDRSIQILRRPRVETLLQIQLPEQVGFVAFESRNQIVHAGTAAWLEADLLPAIRVRGSLRAAPGDSIIIPLAPPDGTNTPAHRPYHDKGSPTLPADRLRLSDQTLIMQPQRHDHGGIGITPSASKGILGHYNPAAPSLTLIQFSRIPGADRYPDSPEAPEGTAAIASVTYASPPSSRWWSRRATTSARIEIETASSTVALPPGGTLVHTHRTFHFTGPREALDTLARQTLGIGLDAVTPQP